jgi:alanyl-tRNA synthetase
VKEIGGKTAFDLWQTYGFPFELTRELVEERGGVLDKSEFDLEFIKHQEKSRTASESVFRGGLADHSENVIKYHTATHLLHAALRKVLGEQVRQRGSNITGGRLRFDFSYGEKVGEKELEEVEKLVNEQIEADLPVSFETMTYDQAIKQGALAFYGEKYPKKVKVYTVGPKREVQGQSPEPADGSPEPASVFSREICGGPHVEHTGVIGKIDIFKETSAGAGVRRIYTRMVE